MNLLEKLDRLIDSHGLNKHTLAKKCGVPYTTIVGLYERGTDKARLSTIQKLCDYFEVPMDYLVYDKYEKPEDFTPNGLFATVVCKTAEEIKLVTDFRKLNRTGVKKLFSELDTYTSHPDLIKETPIAKAT